MTTPRHQYFNIPALIAGGNDTLTDVGEPFVLDGLYEDVVFDVVNTGTNLTKFALLVKAHSSGSWQVYLQTTGWDTVAGTLKKFIGTLKTLATGASGFAHVNVGPVYAVKFQASIANGTRNTAVFTAAANPTNTKAAGTLTLAVAVPSAAETVTLGNKVYTWRDTVATTANEVLIGATLADSCDNLVAAINGAAGSGTLYGSATVAHTQVTAARSGDTVVATAITPGTAANSYATTETGANTSWGAATLEGGTTETVTIDTTVYTFKAATFVTSAYDVLLEATASLTLDNLVAAINAGAGAGTKYGTGTVAHPLVTAAAGAGDTVDITAISTVPNATGTLLATTETCAQCSFAAATMADGVNTDVTIYAMAR